MAGRQTKQCHFPSHLVQFYQSYLVTRLSVIPPLDVLALGMCLVRVVLVLLGVDGTIPRSQEGGSH